MRKPRTVADIISSIYGRRYRLTTPRPRPIAVYDDHSFVFAASSFYERVRAYFSKHPYLILLSIVLIIKIVLSYYYYNRLVFEESNMMASYSNMQVLLQRRNDIGHNLITATHYYAEYEERVYYEVVKLRSAELRNELNKEKVPDKAIPKPDPEGKASVLAAATNAINTGASLLPVLPKLVAVAEQYPQLKSEENYTVLMVAIVELEKDLAAQRIKFNAEANIYTTTLRQFPSILFAKEFGFKNIPYFDSTDDAKKFKLAF